MGRSISIVAIPRADNYVWKLSSEKVPHLTILYLGDSVSDESVQKIKSFVEHASNVSLNRFGLSVERRGELGDKKADVLFFDNEFASKVARFRDMLLLNDTIQQAYHSTEQYPSWTPHLTLGYPDTPAKESENAPHSWVEFDRIAVWDEDYKGLEIALNTQDSLTHYGVSGMKWGVRRSAVKLSRNRKGPVDPPSEDHTRTQKARVKAKRSGRQALSNKELQDVITRLNLEQQYKNLTPTALDKGKNAATKIIAGAAKNQAASIVNNIAAEQAKKLLNK